LEPQVESNFLLMVPILMVFKNFFHRLCGKYLILRGFEEKLLIHNIKKADKKGFKEAKEKLTALFDNPKDFPLFKGIELEMHNRCNNNCSFCPVRVGNDTREYSKMSYELFIKIIDELASINYKSSFSLFSNNEPLMDKRFVEFAKIAKEKLPNANHYIYTNGLLLTVDLFKEISKYLDLIVIDNYDDNLQMIPQVKKIDKFCKENPEYFKKIKISMRLKNQILLSRGGQSPNRKHAITLETPCRLPFEQLIIRPDGKISLCCNDALGKMTLGDVSKDTLVNIWNSPSYFEIRRKSLNSRNNIQLCKNCDLL